MPVALRAGSQIDAGTETFVSFLTPNDYGMTAIGFGHKGHPRHLRYFSEGDHYFQWRSGLAQRPPGYQHPWCPKFALLRLHMLTDDVREVWWLFGHQSSDPWAPLSNPEVQFNVAVDGAAVAEWKVQVEPPAVAVMKTARAPGGWKHQAMGTVVKPEHLAAFSIQF